jgi:hypothetical protein
LLIIVCLDKKHFPNVKTDNFRKEDIIGNARFIGLNTIFFKFDLATVFCNLLA